MKRILLGFSVLFFVTPAHADILIGYVGPVTGTFASLGEKLHHGIQQAVKDINDKGGVDGQKLVLVSEDDACDPKQATATAIRMVNRGVKFVVGPVCSNASLAAAKIYNARNVVMISPAVTSPALTEAGYKTVFRVCGRDDREGLIQGRYILKHYRDYKMAILHDNSDSGRRHAESFRNVINEAGVREVLFDSYNSGAKDYSALVARLKKNDIQLLEIGGAYPDVALIAQQIKQQKVDIKVIGGDVLANDAFWKITDNAGEGVMMSALPDATRLPGAAMAMESLQAAHIDPSGSTLYGYAAVQVFADAIKKAGYPDPQKVASVMRKNTFDTALGKIGFGDSGDVIGLDYAIYNWHDGKYAEIAN